MQPPLDLRHDESTTYKLAVVCKKCRIHADIRIDHSNSTDPCPASSHPLHHFQRVTSHDRKAPERIRFAWQCSVDECRATLLILFRRPRISEADLSHLTNPELLKRRYNALLQDDPNREGIRQATEMDALARLRRYIKDALNPEHNKRVFPANNKRFQEAFGMSGRDCHELLEELGFKYTVSSVRGGHGSNQDSCDKQDNNWHLPNPDTIADRLQTDGSTGREMLEDVEIELLACMFELAAKQGHVNPASGEGWYSANRDIERTLAAQGCTSHYNVFGTKPRTKCGACRLPPRSVTAHRVTKR